VKNVKEKFIELELIIDEANKGWPSKTQTAAKSRLSTNKNNQAIDALIKIFKYFEENREEADHILSELMKHENEQVRTGAATHCLALNIRTDQALGVLKQTFNDVTPRWAKMQASGTLMIYEQQGYLTMYR